MHRQRHAMGPGAAQAQPLPPNLKILFSARPPLAPLPTLTDALSTSSSPSATAPAVVTLGRTHDALAPMMSRFSEALASLPPSAPILSQKERQVERKGAKEARLEEAKKEGLSTYDPNNDSNAMGMDAYRTMFLGRLNYVTTEKTIDAEMRRFGNIKKVKLVTNKETGKSRGYAFVEFSRERDMKDALHSIKGGLRIDGRPVIADVERGRTVRGWLPRRLGGGAGLGRASKPPGQKRADLRMHDRGGPYRGGPKSYLDRQGGGGDRRFGQRPDDRRRPY